MKTWKPHVLICWRQTQKSKIKQKTRQKAESATLLVEFTFRFISVILWGFSDIDVSRVQYSQIQAKGALCVAK